MISTVLNNQTKQNFTKKRSSIFSILLLAISLIDVAGAANYYVSTTGSDSRTPAQAQNSATPWKTIQKAASNVAPGAVVHVAPGTYTSLTTIRKSGTASARITFISDTKWGAKIKASANAVQKEALIQVNGNYVDIKGFELIGSGIVREAIWVAGSYVRVIGNKIHDISGVGVKTWVENYNFRNIDILGNLIYNVGGHGIYVMQKGGSVSNNIVFNSKKWGIHAWHAANALTFSNNLTYNCGLGGLTIGAGDDPYGVVADNFVVTNNISVFNGKYGITENGYSGKNNVYKNNLVYGNGWAGFDLLNGNTAQNTLTVNPQLVNFQPNGIGDYHLSATSPAIKRGTTLGAPSDDFDGFSRTGIPDIGPYKKK